MTVGVAILNLSGEILNVKSFKEASRADITRHIISYGKTVLVATDVHNPPKMVKKMAASLNSKIYFPYRDMAVSAKNELVDDYIYSHDHNPQTTRSKDASESIPQNAHERDALAAAIQGYKKYQKKLEQIERKTQETELTPQMVDEIKVSVINEIPITKAINSTINKFIHQGHSNNEKSSNDDMVPDLMSEDSHEIIHRLQSKVKSQEKQIKNLKSKNSILEYKVNEYQDEISLLENKIQKLQYQYSQNILQQKEIATKNSIIKGIQEKYYHEKELRKTLEEQLESIKRMRAMELSREAVPVKIIDTFSKDGIREAASSRNIKRGDVVLLKSSEGGGSHTASLIVKLGVKAVITTDKMSHQAKEEFEKHMIPLLEEGEVDLKMADEFAIILSRDLEREIEKWNNHQKEKLKKEERNRLLKIMDDYKAQRKRSNNNFH